MIYRKFLFALATVPAWAFAGLFAGFFDSTPPGLASATDYDSSIVVKISLASDASFIGRKVSGYTFGDHCYLVPDAARALGNAEAELRRKDNHLRLYVTECWRPPAATTDLVGWAQATDKKKIKRDQMSARELSIFQDPDLFDKDKIFRPLNMFPMHYLSQNSVHSAGKAVDVTLVSADGGLLDMGTAIDVFSRSAHRGAGGSRAVAANRRTLDSVMSSAGFSGIQTEWWHFNY